MEWTQEPGCAKVLGNFKRLDRFMDGDDRK